jgi:hypothetical protein
LDVQARQLTPDRRRRVLWALAVSAAALLGLVLRLKGIHNPLLDHPGWRQGDEASIAHNFATLQYNIFYPQTNYNGPPPNYVELELQIVPFLAASAYKVFGIHEIAGRLITIAFSIGTIVVLAFFGRWLFASAVAGALAAVCYAVMPGAVYYGRAFTPDTAMVFFMTAALYATARLAIDRERWRPRDVCTAGALLALALLAKPVAAVALVPVAVLLFERARSGRTFSWPLAAALVAVPLLVLWGYDRIVSSHAEWHWSSGILTLHVLPALRASLQNGPALGIKLQQFRVMLGVFASLLAGPAITGAAVLGFLLPGRSVRSRSLLWSWLAGGLLYVYVVVTVERVDYYMLLLLPLAALAAGGVLARLALALASSALPPAAKYAAVALGCFGLVAVTVQNLEIVRPYYAYSKSVYRNAVTLDKTLAAGALVVMGHYDPSVLYYIGRYGWEEDPYLWTPFDEQSAIRKGARYFIAIEQNRFSRNVELCAWMQRFPLLHTRGSWPVYATDPRLVKPGADARWRAFRNAERAGHAREWLSAQHLCART